MQLCHGALRENLVSFKDSTTGSVTSAFGNCALAKSLVYERVCLSFCVVAGLQALVSKYRRLAAATIRITATVLPDSRRKTSRIHTVEQLRTSQTSRIDQVPYKERL